MADQNQASTPVSADLEPNATANPIIVQLSDGTDLALIDGSGNLNVALASGGSIQITDGTDTLGVVKDADVVSAGTGGLLALGSDGSNYQVLLTETTGALVVSDGGGTLTVDGTVTSEQGTAAASAGAWPVKITDGTDDALVTAAGALQVDLASQSLTAVAVSRDGAANSDTNPLFVQVTSGAVVGTEVHDYNTAASIAAGATSDHTYTASGGTFLWKAAIVASALQMKAEFKAGATGAPTSKAVVFTTPARLTEFVVFDPPIEVPDTEVARITRTQRGTTDATDLYSTIVGSQV
jgi:hypothetical protein